MSEKDEQRLEDEEATEASEHDEETPEVEGHRLHIGDRMKVGDPDAHFKAG
jgi:hypothetical protein